MPIASRALSKRNSRSEAVPCSQTPSTLPRRKVREFVDYMNKNQQIEGTVTNEGLEGPGCLQWRINSANGQPEMYATGKKQGCVSVEDAIKKFKLP